MALRFVDSFDHYSSGAVQPFRKWSASRNGSPAFPSVGTGRFGGNSWSFGERWTRKDFPDSQATWTVGAALQPGLVTSVNAGLFSWLDSGTFQLELRWDANTKQLRVTRNGTQLGSAYNWAYLPFTFYYVEFKCTIDNTAGAYEVRVDGATVLSGTSQDTQNTANASANQLRIGSPADISGNQTYLDDLYVCDGTGSAPDNTFLGDVHIECLFPDGNGATSNMVGSDADSTDNYLLVDDPYSAVDDDTTYTESSTATDKDLYTYDDLVAASGTVYGVQIVPLARKTDAGTRSIVAVARESGGTEADSAVQTLTSSYVYYPVIMTAKPSTGAWAVSDVNGAQFGWKVNA